MNTISKITHWRAGIARMGMVSGTLVPTKRHCKDTSLPSLSQGEAVVLATAQGERSQFRTKED